MNLMTRVATLMALVLLLAACTGSGVGLGGSEAPSEPATSGASPAPSASAPAEGEEDGPQRVDMSALAADAGTFVGQEVRVLARIDEVVADGSAFLTSPSGTAESQLAVIVMPDATVDVELAQHDVVWVDGTVVGVSPDDLEAAGVDLSPEDLGGYAGDYAIVASAIADPLAGS